ncbi:flagellar type III secretion system protein FliR [Rhizobium daejeonense]|uniref:Flagellar biosynthetic protein FliR n=1 Tax=Rhizobium daejeonense TaxID=240521 RepID=A0A6M1SB63_9HYPH|nr:flagellar biosynthetic protein FliR [Rhizobium daejeonense]NGO66727.1 flagellar type III secretion system protein FliR [Rhizobium daejeonense]
MISDPQGTVMALFLAFCRIGGCMMTMPTFSSARMPMQIRLFLSLSMSIALLPLFWDILYPRATGDMVVYVMLIFSETLTGVMFGLIAHLYTMGIQFAGTVIGMSIAFNSQPTSDPLDDSSQSHLTTLMTFGALLVLFATDFHHIVIKALADSYEALPIGRLIDPQQMLISLTDTMSATFIIMLRLASPFLLFGLLFNVVVGLINKLAPQIPLYFISTPYALFGGLLLLYFAIAALLDQFAQAFAPIFNNL